MLDQAMSFDEFALICTYLVISVLSQIKFFLDFPNEEANAQNRHSTYCLFQSEYAYPL